MITNSAINQRVFDKDVISAIRKKLKWVYSHDTTASVKTSISLISMDFSYFNEIYGDCYSVIFSVDNQVLATAIIKVVNETSDGVKIVSRSYLSTAKIAHSSYYEF